MYGSHVYNYGVDSNICFVPIEWLAMCVIHYRVVILHWTMQCSWVRVLWCGQWCTITRWTSHSVNRYNISNIIQYIMCYVTR